jgi:hypothetical protein
MAKVSQLTLDPPVPPSRVVPGHPQDQLLHRRSCWRPSRPTPVGVSPVVLQNSSRWADLGIRKIAYAAL